MSRILALVYAGVAYAAFLVTFLYAIGFVGNFVVPKSIDSGVAPPTGQALMINLLLLALFAVQHSGMARIGFKKWWTRFVPQPLERSTYVLVSSIVLALLYWLWQPMPGIIWNVENALGAGLLWALFALGWVIVFLSSFMIDHFDLFGLRQVMHYLRGQPYSPPGFKVPLLYRLVRHPLMLGFVIAFWATPTMTVGHLLFAAMTTAYILIALQLEERDLVHFHGEEYRRYQGSVSMLFPWPRRRAKGRDRGTA